MKRAFVAAVLVAGFMAPRAAAAQEKLQTHEEGPPPARRLDGQQCDLAELERLHGSTNDFKVLRDIGRCLEDLGDSVRAATTLKRYLDEGGNAVPEDERAKTVAWLAQVPSRVARISISSNVSSVEIRIDGQCAVDETSFEPVCTSREGSRVILVNPGEHRLTVKHAGYRDVAHAMTLNAGEHVRVLANAASLVAEINPYREPMWTGWAVTGGLLVGGTVIGIRTAAARDELDSPTGIATVGLGAGALVAAGIATYFTVRNARWRPTHSPDVAFDLFGIHGRF